MGVEPPTGDEKPQKYYGSAYLDEVQDFKEQVRTAAANGTEINTENVNPLTIAEVAPELLTSDQEEEVFKAKDHVVQEPKTNVEAAGDKEWRVEAGQDTLDPSRDEPEKAESDNEEEDTNGQKPTVDDAGDSDVDSPSGSDSEDRLSNEENESKDDETPDWVSKLKE